LTWTPVSAGTRYRIPLISGGTGLTSGRVVYNDSNGRLKDETTFGYREADATYPGLLQLGYSGSTPKPYAKIYTLNDASKWVQYDPPVANVVATENPDFNGPYFIGDTVQYIVYGYRIINGQKVYEQTATASNIVTITVNNASVDVTWDNTFTTNQDIWRKLNGGVDEFAWLGFSTTATGIYDSVDYTWNYSSIYIGPPALPDFSCLYNYWPNTGGNFLYGVFGGAGYFDGEVGINVIPTSGIPLVVKQDDVLQPAAVIIGGYSSGGYGTKHTLQINNSNGQKVVGINGGNLYPADAGYIDLFGYPTSSFDQYQWGSINFYNYSGEATGDLRMGLIDCIRDGGAYTGTIRFTPRKDIGGFTVALTVKFSGHIGFNGVTSPTAWAHLPAGSTAASSAPLKFTSGSLQTTAEAGAMEFLTDKFYGTITTGSARKEFTLNDAALTSGRIPFMTTNGRLTDSSAFLFATGTGITLTDLNFVLGTTTGSKIGTSTSQKLSFFNSTPIVQPGATTDLGTVLSNLGLRASGTAYPITTSGAVSFTGGLTVSTTGLTITDVNVILNTTTGTKFGTATTQKLSFFNSTPVVQPAATTTAGAAVVTTASTNVTPFGYTTAAQADDIITQLNRTTARLNDIYTKLQTLGLIA
jgi:hypothetical protein